jgi:NADP-dependent 3-hydroxy acid dehydrogenase YdfG
MTSLRGKTALVTGGSSGVGKATVKALISEGVHVTAVARGADRLRALEAEVGDGLVPLDVGKVASAILTALRGGVSADVNAIAVNGDGIEPLT